VSITVAIPGQTGRLTIDIDWFRARILQDALIEATADYWEQRAQAFEAAAPKLGEYHGSATRDELNEAWTRCHNTAATCRAHAQLIRESQSEEISAEVFDVLAEVA
jgi:aminoglycoside phosphotransferase family enzyme